MKGYVKDSSGIVFQFKQSKPKVTKLKEWYAVR